MEKIIVKINPEDYTLLIEMEGYEDNTCITDIEEIQELLNAFTLYEKKKKEAEVVKNGCRSGVCQNKSR
jgi:hypothetical protein